MLEPDPVTPQPPDGEAVIDEPHWPGVFADFHRLWGRRARGPHYNDLEKLAWAELLQVLQHHADRDGHFARLVPGRRLK